MAQTEGAGVITSLIRYEAARTALAEAHRVDEVKDIRDKAEAMAAYARQAKDSELIQYATEIKVRAEQRCGELLAMVDRQKGGRPSANSSKAETSYQAVLRQNNLHPATADRYQQLAAMPAEHFETAVATAKATAGEVTTAFMLREARKGKPAKPMKGRKAEAMRAALDEARARGVSMLTTYIRLTLSAIRSQQEFTGQERELLVELAGAIHQRSIIA